VADHDLAWELARRARRTALSVALANMGAALTIDRLSALMRGVYGEDLAEITVLDLTQPASQTSLLPRGSSIEDAVLHVFERLPSQWLTSGFFIRHLALQRWTAQALLAELAERGLLERDGKTSGTKYRLAHCPRLVS
jgi:hypothetical protein